MHLTFILNQNVFFVFFLQNKFKLRFEYSNITSIGGFNMTKLSKIVIDNLKNVSHGEIDFKIKNKYLNVTGIYGQNGSGKTTLVDAMSIFHTLSFGESLNKNTIDFMDDEHVTTISITFENDEYAYEYRVELVLREKHIIVAGESINRSKLPNYKYVKEVISYSYNHDQNKAKINSTIKDNDLQNLTLSIIANAKEGKSFLFGSTFNEWVIINHEIKKYSTIIESLEILRNSSFNINIHTEEMNGYLATGNVMHLSFALSQKGGKHTAGVLPIQLNNVTGSNNNIKYDENTADLIEKIFKKISDVIEEIIPGLEIITKFRSQTSSDGNTEEYSLEILTKRSGKIIPLRAESLGVQKLVSVLALLIEVYNNPNQIVLIDELDSGIFEFLLGEIVQIMSDDAKGQLIFTSHNLRVLETLPYYKIYFTTENANDRYVQITGTRESNNLRNVYLRELRLNNLGLDLYRKTDSTKIKFAFEDSDLSKNDITSDGNLFNFEI